MTIPAGARVFIIEDEALISLMLEDAMLALGLVVAATAMSVSDALAAIEGPLDFDLASVDLNLRGQISVPVVEALAARGIPFIVTTGYDDQAIPPAFRGRPRVQKPFETDAIAEAISALGLKLEG